MSFNHCKESFNRATIVHRQQYPSDPGMVWFSETFLIQKSIEKGLREEIQLEELPPNKSWGGHGADWCNARSSLASQSKTYEAIAWRMPRPMVNDSWMSMPLNASTRWKEHFSVEMTALQSSLLAPRGVSPVLFGIRAWEQRRGNGSTTLMLKEK